MFTDIAGYTAMMGKDENRAAAALKLSRTTVHAQVAKHDGTVLDNVGDGTLSTFESAVSAVECAREIQARMAGEDFELRIGIHIGDVLVSADGVVGDGVNVASRIHGPLILGQADRSASDTML
jgi:class 3 adenylate cyclase